MVSGGMRPLVIAALLLLGSGLTQAQSNWSLVRASLVSGGGVCTNGPITLRATLGQPAAGGPLTGGGYSLTGGLLAEIAAVQTPGAPLLTITNSGGNIVLSWAGPATGYVLQQTTAISGGDWTEVNLTPVDNGGRRSVTLAVAPGNRFFRLKR